MTRMLLTLQAWMVARAANEEGATAVEYGLMVSLIAVAIIITVRALGVALDGIFAAVVAAL